MAYIPKYPPCPTPSAPASAGNYHQQYQPTNSNSALFDAVAQNSVNEVTEVLHNLTNNQPPSLLNNCLNYTSKNTEPSHSQGQFPIHIAASNFNLEILQLLLSVGANPNVLDFNGTTPILTIIKKLCNCCKCGNCKRKAIKCIRLLATSPAAEFNTDLNIGNKHGETPIYLAAIHGFQGIAIELIRNGAAIVGPDGFSGSMIRILLEKIPEVILEVFDRSVTMSTEYLPHEKELYLTFDMNAIVAPTIVVKNNGNNNSSSRTSKRNNSPRREMGFLCDLLESSLSHDIQIYKSVLQHPLVHVFADIKWNRLKFLYVGYLMVQVNFMAWYMIFLFMVVYIDCGLKPEHYIDAATGGGSPGSILTSNDTLIELNKPDFSPNSCKIHLLTKLVGFYVLISCAISFCKELFHCFLDFWFYIYEISNYIQITGLVTIFITILIVLEPFQLFLQSYLYPFAAFSLGICWFQLFLQIGRLPSCAMYLEMLNKILVNFLMSLGMYSFILLAFASSYWLLFCDMNNNSSSKFTDFILAMQKILSMMVGELDYESFFSAAAEHQGEGHGELGQTPEENLIKSKYPIFIHLWYATAVVVVSMVLMNLLVGLAVSDISKCKQTAALVVIQRRIRYLNYLEKSFYLGTIIAPCTCLRDFLRKRVAIVVPNDALINMDWFKARIFSNREGPIGQLLVVIKPNDNRTRISKSTKQIIKEWVKKMQTLQSHVGHKDEVLGPGHDQSSKPATTTAANTSRSYSTPTRTIRVNSSSTSTGNKDKDITNANANNEDAAVARLIRFSVESRLERLEQRLLELDTKLDTYFTQFMFIRHQSDD